MSMDIARHSTVEGMLQFGYCIPSRILLTQKGNIDISAIQLKLHKHQLLMLLNSDNQCSRSCPGLYPSPV